MNLARTIAVFAIFALLAGASRAQSNRPSQTFDTSAGAVKVTPIYHATMLIEAEKYLRGSCEAGEFQWTAES